MSAPKIGNCRPQMPAAAHPQIPIPARVLEFGGMCDLDPESSAGEAVLQPLLHPPCSGEKLACRLGRCGLFSAA
jgi:hypothetical protein